MTTIFAVVLLIGIAISAWLLLVLRNFLRRQSKSTELLESFEEAAGLLNLSLTKREVLGDRIVGLDEAKSKVLFLSATGDQPDLFLIDLEDVKSVTLVKQFGFIDTGIKSRETIEALVSGIELQLNFKNGSDQLAIPFYDKRSDPFFVRLERSEKAGAWEILLSERLAGSVRRRFVGENGALVGFDW